MTSPGAREYRALRIAAVAAITLLLNATTLAPALHSHAPGHNPAVCPVCMLQAHGAWTPADPGPVQGVERSHLPAPDAPGDPVLPAHIHAEVARGPPAAG